MKTNTSLAYAIVFEKEVRNLNYRITTLEQPLVTDIYLQSNFHPSACTSAMRSSEPVGLPFLLVLLLFASVSEPCAASFRESVAAVCIMCLQNAGTALYC